jgi:hypothetical protein
VETTSTQRDIELQWREREGERWGESKARRRKVSLYMVTVDFIGSERGREEREKEEKGEMMQHRTITKKRSSSVLLWILLRLFLIIVKKMIGKGKREKEKGCNVWVY